nr:aminoacyl-tRNA hydrolase [Acidithiobacillus ferrooxidans]
MPPSPGGSVERIVRRGREAGEGALPAPILPKVASKAQNPEWAALWMENEFTKIVVSVNSERELLDLDIVLAGAGVPCALIQDLGHTEFHGEKTYTALGIGPAPSELIDPHTRHLLLL